MAWHYQSMLLLTGSLQARYCAEWLKIDYRVGVTLRMKASMYLKGVGDGVPEVKIATKLLGNS